MNIESLKLEQFKTVQGIAIYSIGKHYVSGLKKLTGIIDQISESIDQFEIDRLKSIVANNQESLRDEDLKDSEWIKPIIQGSKRVFWYSLFAHKYNTFEFYLGEYVETIGSFEQRKSAPNDLKEDIPKKYFKYLKEVCNYNLNLNNKTINEIYLIESIRHIITHHNAVIPDKKKYKALKDYIKRNEQMIRIDRLNRIEFEIDFLTHTQNLLINYFNGLIDLVEQRHQFPEYFRKYFNP